MKGLKKMTIICNNKEYQFNNDICNAFKNIIGLDIDENDIKNYLNVYTKQDPEISLKTLSEKDVVYIVEKCIKDEIIDIYGEDIWNDLMDNK